MCTTYGPLVHFFWRRIFQSEAKEFPGHRSAVHGYHLVLDFLSSLTGAHKNNTLSKQSSQTSTKPQPIFFDNVQGKQYIRKTDQYSSFYYHRLQPLYGLFSGWRGRGPRRVDCHTHSLHGDQAKFSLDGDGIHKFAKTTLSSFHGCSTKKTSKPLRKGKRRCCSNKTQEKIIGTSSTPTTSCQPHLLKASSVAGVRKGKVLIKIELLI